MDSFEYSFLAPPRIQFGWGHRREAGPLAATLGRRAFLVVGSRTLTAAGAIDEIEQSLRKSNVEVVPLATISREPQVADVDAAAVRLREHNAGHGDFLLGIGGGSALDLAKAAAAMATNFQESGVVDFLEGVGRGLKLERPPLPVMALPTTAGTGTEATKNAVISCYDPAFKKSLRSELMVPRIVLIDPELTVSLPPHVTAHTGMDAITQSIESYISRRTQPIPRALARQGVQLAVDSIVEAVQDGTSRRARERMAHAALLSGMALANSGLGMAHGVAAALGVHCRVPHGLACGVMLPVALGVNRSTCTSRLAELARAMTPGVWSTEDAAADAAVECIREIADEIGISRRLSQIGVTREQLPAIAAGSRGNSMDGNPRSLGDDELLQILEQAL